MNDIELLDSQNAALNYLMSPKFKAIREVLYGGKKGGGKSFLGCLYLTQMSLSYPGTSYFAARNTLTDLRKHTIPSFIEVFNLRGIRPTDYKYNAQDSIITFYNNSRIILVSTEYMPSDPMYERFGSMQNTQGWIEEGGEHHVMAYENLKLTIGRCKNLEYNIPFKLLITANPKKNWMKPRFIDKIDLTDCRYVPAGATENIFLPQGYLDTLELITDKVQRQRLLLGNWDYDDDDDALISYNKILDTFTNEFVPNEGLMYISSDIAITNDYFVIVVWRGLRIIDIFYQKNMSKQEVSESNGVVTSSVNWQPLLDKFNEYALKYKVPRSCIVYDADGIGHHMKNMFSGAVPIHTGTPAISKEYFNLKSQLYFQLAELVNNNMIHIANFNQELKDKIIEELGLIKRHKDVDKLRIVSKADIKKILKRSTDISDAIAYRLLFWIQWKK